MKIDVKPTAQIISDAAGRMRQAADELDRCAVKMVKSGDLDYAAEAIGTIVNVINLTRMDLLVTRPLRALGKEGP